MPGLLLWPYQILALRKVVSNHQLCASLSTMLVYRILRRIVLKFINYIILAHLSFCVGFRLGFCVGFVFPTEHSISLPKITKCLSFRLPYHPY